jgi:hypothetical protein
VQNNIIISWVAIMGVLAPGTDAEVNLDITAKLAFADHEPRSPEIGPGGRGD